MHDLAQFLTPSRNNSEELHEKYWIFRENDFTDDEIGTVTRDVFPTSMK